METYEIIRLREDTWQLENQFVRCFLLAGREKALLIDSGVTMPNAKQIAEVLTGLPVELINTHADGDHISGNGSFDWFYMHPSECANYYREGRTGQFRPVYEGDVIDLGDRELEVVAIPGHTPGSIALLDRKYNALMGGDPVQNGEIFLFGPYREMHAYIAGLRKLDTRRDFELVYPSHGTCPIDRKIIPQLIDAAEEILAGKRTAEQVSVFGTDVAQYDMGCAVFLCDKQ